MTAKYQPPFVQVNKAVVGAGVTITRPNNANAYAGGQVWGSGTDGRFQITAPALPADAVNQGTPGYSNLSLIGIDGVVPSAAAFTVNVYLFSAVPATVLADQAAFSISDADIALLMSSAPTIGFTSGAGAVSAMNQSAAAAGRRANNSNQLLAGGGAQPIVAGTTLGIYLVLSAAYTPVALETMTLVPIWSYPAKQT